MLGIFKGKNKEKTIEKEEQKQKRTNEIKEKGKEDKFSRFSFKRRKSSEKKKKIEGAETSSSSSTSSAVSWSSAPSSCDEKAIQNDNEKSEASEEISEKLDVSGSISERSSTLSESLVDHEQAFCNVGISSSVNENGTQASNHSSELDDSFSASDSSTSRSEAHLQKSQLNNGRIYLKDQQDSPKIRNFNTFSNYSNNIINSPLSVSRNHPNITSSSESIRTLTHSQSNDGSLSMLSTPSSSTSSLSSISNRPISPSGRGTPPGPKLGTALRIPSSPTPIRKTSRTHIKTNPTMSSTTRRVGSISPSSLPTSDRVNGVPFASLEKPDRQIDQNSAMLSKSPIITRASESKPVFNFQENPSASPPQSPSSNSSRLRHSVSSMKSLESIPEIDSDATAETKETLRRNTLKNSPKSNCKAIITSSSVPLCKESCIKTNKPGKVISTNLLNNPVAANCKSLLDCKRLTKAKLNETNAMKCNLDAKNKNITSKPPSISKRLNEHDAVWNQTNSLERPERHISSNSNNIPKVTLNNIESTSLPSASRKREETTRVVFRIAINDSQKKTSSLENLSSNKTTFKEDIFPRSASPLRPLIRARKSKSLTRVDAIQNGTSVKFEIPFMKIMNDKEESKEDTMKMKGKSNSTVHKNQINKKDCIPNCKQSKAKIANDDNRAQSPKTKLGSDTHAPPKHSLQSSHSYHPVRFPENHPQQQKSPKKPRPVLKVNTKPLATNIKANDETCKIDSDFKNEISLQRIHPTGPSAVTSFATPSETPPETPTISQNSLEISDTDSVNQDTSNSQKIVQEMITIQIEDSPNFISSKMDFDSSFEKIKMVEHKLIQTDENRDVGEKELSGHEERFQKQVDDLSRKLSEKQKEVKDLSEELKESKQATLKKDSSTQRYEIQIDQLKTQVREEETKAESVRIELQYARNETELTKAKMRRLEDELTKANEVADSLREQNANRSRDSNRLKELEDKVKDLEDQLKKSECTRKDLEKSLTDIENERDEELKIVQDALDEAAEERQELISSFKKELEMLNTTNTAREQQMLEDFEWKLHEMEKDYKSKLEENSKQAEEKLKTLRSRVESELSDTLTTVTEERKMADEKLMEVGHLKSYEAEVIQLRGVTHEFQKALRASAREMENLKLRERLLNDEIRGLKMGAQSRQNTLQRVKRHTDDEEVRQKMEKLRNEINAEWEDKLRKECSRLKSELDDLHSEEKHLAVESMKVQKEQEIQRLRKSWEQRQEEMANQVSSLKDNLADKDAYFHRELDNQRTMTDRDLWDLRMKLQKLNESSYDQKQQLEEKYREDIERLRVDYEDRIRELESRLAICDAQKGIDLLGQMEKDHKMQMQHVGEQHQLSMERLREELEAEKFQAVEDTRLIITNHHIDIETNLKEKLAQMQTSESQIRDELEAVRFSLQRREETVRTLEEELERCRELKGDSYSSTTSSFPPAASTTSSGFSSSQFSLASSNDSQGSRNSQDRYSYNDSGFLAEGQDDSQRNSGLLGKVFGGGWFTPSKPNNRRGSTPLSSKKPYS